MSLRPVDSRKPPSVPDKTGTAASIPTSPPAGVSPKDEFRLKPPEFSLEGTARPYLRLLGDLDKVGGILGKRNASLTETVRVFRSLPSEGQTEILKTLGEDPRINRNPNLRAELNNLWGFVKKG